MTQVVVIGAGPAGAAAALGLAHAGVEVLLIEQHRFPRDKVCGECLSAIGIEVLTRLGVAPAVQALRPAILRKSVVFLASGRTVELPMRRPMWGISRRALDLTLLQAARAAGVRVLQPARCEQIDGGDPVRVRVRTLEHNALQTLDATFVIVADGKGSLMNAAPAATRDLGLKAHFTGVRAPADTIELFGVEGHYGGVAPVEDGLWNVAFSIPAARLRNHGRNHDALFGALLSENRGLADRMNGAMRVSDWLASPLPRFGVMSSWPRGVIPIGNSAAAIEPIGGEGMGLALRSAELATSAIVQAISDHNIINAQRLARAYKRLWNMRRAACRAGARIVSSPALSKLAVPLAEVDPLGALVLRLVGK
jgi:flavin-dependent dehydrogenase